MISQILRQTRRSQLLAAAENTDDADNEGGKEIIAVFECKHCDKVSKSEEEMYEHVEDCHRTGRETRASARSPSARSVVLKGLLATSFQKNVYVPEHLMCTDDDEQPEMYTVYGCTLCHYQHLSNTQVRKHGTMCHFLEIPVFSCLYCKVAVADRAVFHRHLEHDHRLMKVDFSFDCKALTLLNQFLSESLYQIHIKKEGFYEVIKDRSEQFTHYSKQKMLSLIQSEDTKEKVVDSTSSESPPAKSPRKVTRQISSPSSPHSPASLQLTEDKEVTNSKAETETVEESSSMEGITQSSTPTKGFPRNTVRAILDSMVQRKTGTKKKYLRGAVKDLLKELREESGKADTTEGLVEMASEAIVDAESEISSPQNKSSVEAIVQQTTQEMSGEKLESPEHVTKVKIENVEVENIEEVPEKAKATVDLNVPEPNNQETPKRRRGRPRKSDKFQMMDTQKSSKEGCIEIHEEDVILRVKKEVEYEEIVMPEKEESAVIQPVSEQITPKRRRGRPRKSGPLVEKDKEYKPQFEQSPMRKKAKIDYVTENSQLDAIVDSPGLSPGRYNFRNRKNNKSFTDELQQSEEELEEEENERDEEQQKRPTLHSLVDTKQKMFVKTFRKLVSKSEIPPEKIEERLPKPIAPEIIKSLAAQPPVATVISPPMQAMQPGLRPQTYVMVNGRLLPVLNQSQVLQLGTNTGARPQIIQLPSPQPLQQQPPQIQVQQQPVRISLPSNPNLILNLLSQPQQQQLQPILNQQTQQPLIIQQPGGLQGNQTFQLLPQNNTMMLQGSVPNLQQGQMPFIIRPVTSNVLNLGNQILTPVSVPQQAPTPVLGTNVSSTTVPSNPQPIPVKPIVIEPKEDLSDPIEIAGNSDSETEADAEPEDCSSTDVASAALSEQQKNIKQFYIQLYVCRRCMQIFLTPLDLDQHLYIEELQQNPTMNVPFSNVGQDFFRKLTITPMVSILLKDSDWNLPVFRCGSCGIVHILESFVKKHVREHASGLKCLKESLWSPSDLRVLCAKGWTTSVKMQCREQQVWANIFYKQNRGRLINNGTMSRENMRVSISELEKIDAEAKGQAANKKAASQLTSILQAPQQPVLQQADSQAPIQLKTQDTMAQATVGMHPGQVPLQGRFLNFVKPTVTNIAPKVPANQIFSGTQILQLPGTRIIQLPSVSQPAPIQIMPITQPAAMGQPLNMIPQPIPSSSKLEGTSFFCKKCQFKHTTSDGVKDHVLQNHMEDFGPAFKCTACSEAAYNITKITEHIMSKHPSFKSPFQVNRVYDPEVAAKTLITSGQTTSASAGSGQQQQNKQSVDASRTVEQMEPDSSCDAGQGSSEQKLVETTGTSNLSGISAPNILSCFSEEDEGAGRLDEKLLAYSEKRIIHDDDDDLVDEDESENTTGEAYACRLCAYSCDTEQRVKSHLMSAHISADMYPFKCVSCKYEAPSVLRLAQHVLYKHQKQAKKNPPKLAKEMEKDKDVWSKIMRDANKYERFQQELDCLFRNCVEKC